MELTANYAKETVEVRQLGLRPSSIRDTDLTKGAVGTLDDGMILKILSTGEYGQRVEFSALGMTPNKEARKRPLDSGSCSPNIHTSKKQKLDNSAADDSENDSDDSERAAVVEEQLRQMREEMKKKAPKRSATELGDDVPEEPQLKKAKVKAALGDPAEDSTWKEISKLMVYTKKGVRPGSKVQ